MRARECASRARQIVAQELGHQKFKVECPPRLRRKGLKGDEGHYGRIIFLRIDPCSSVDYKCLEEISQRVTNTIEEVNTVVYDITSVASLNKAAIDAESAEFKSQSGKRKRDAERARAFIEK